MIIVIVIIIIVIIIIFSKMIHKSKIHDDHVICCLKASLSHNELC